MDKDTQWAEGSTGGGGGGFFNFVGNLLTVGKGALDLRHQYKMTDAQVAAYPQQAAMQQQAESRERLFTLAGAAVLIVIFLVVLIIALK